MTSRFCLAVVVLGLALGVCQQNAYGQGYGTDTQNVLAPAAGGMAGVSLAEPQDVPAAIFGNPAALTQFRGTQFTLGGAWAEGYPTVTNSGVPGGAGPFSATSRTQGFASPEIGVIQDLRPVGVPGDLGLGFATLSGLGAEYRGLAPAGSLLNNVSNTYVVFGINAALGVELTDRLSAGAAITLGSGLEQLGVNGPLVSSAMVTDYGLRGTFGLDYAINPCNTVGVFYQTRLDFQFSNAVTVTNGANANVYRDLTIAQPQTIGLGFANRSLMGGNLLLAADVYYKLWDDVPLYDRHLCQSVGLRPGRAAHPRQKQIPPRLFVQHQPLQPLGGRQS